MSLLSCKFSVEKSKSTDSLVGVPLYVTNYFSLAIFKIPFVFWHFLSGYLKWVSLWPGEFMFGPLRAVSWSLVAFCPSQTKVSCWFSVTGTPLPGIDALGWAAPYGAGSPDSSHGTSTVEIPLPFLNLHATGVDLPGPRLCHSYPSGHGFFLISFFIGLLFS